MKTLSPRWMRATLLFVLLMLLAACGGATNSTATPLAATATQPVAASATTAAAPTATTADAPTATTADAPTATTADAPTVAPTATEFVPIEGALIVYSGRGESLVGEILAAFEAETGIDLQIKYGDTTGLAATLLEEGDASPADLFFSQDGGALGAVSAAGLLTPLPETVLSKVDQRFRAENGEWVGISGRARVAVYNTDLVQESEMPASIVEFTDPKWKGKLGWAPTNASLQTFITALRKLQGEDAARAWLEGIMANEPKVYASNGAALQGVASGEVSVGLINHYYLMQSQAQGQSANVKNYFFKKGDPGALINVAGMAVLKSSDKQELALQLIDYLLSEKGQKYFSDKSFEYPLAAGVAPSEKLPPLAEIESPEIDLSTLEDLEGTVELLQDVGAL